MIACTVQCDLTFVRHFIKLYLETSQEQKLLTHVLIYLHLMGLVSLLRWIFVTFVLASRSYGTFSLFFTETLQE